MAPEPSDSQVGRPAVNESFELRRSYRFEAAHHLPNAPTGHRCQRLHGHSYELTVVVRGPIDPDAGWVMDFADIDQVVEPVLAELDHRLLNDVDGLENPTSEVLARWIWDRLEALRLAEVRVSETLTSACIYRGSAGG